MPDPTQPLYAELEAVLWEQQKLQHCWDQGMGDPKIFWAYEDLDRRAGDLLARIREWTVS